MVVGGERGEGDFGGGKQVGGEKGKTSGALKTRKWGRLVGDSSLEQKEFLAEEKHQRKGKYRESTSTCQPPMEANCCEIPAHTEKIRTGDRKTQSSEPDHHKRSSPNKASVIELGVVTVMQWQQ